MVLEMANIPGIVGIMELVIVIALLSAFNAQLYGSSRLCYSLATRRDAPRIFARVSENKVPVPAVLLSVFFGLLSVGLQWWNPTGLLDFLLNAVGGVMIVVWLLIAASYLRLHPQLERSGEISTVRMWGYPWLAWAVVAAVLGLVVLMLFDAGSRSQIFSVGAVFIFLAALSLTTRGRATDATRA